MRLNLSILKILLRTLFFIALLLGTTYAGPAGYYVGEEVRLDHGREDCEKHGLIIGRVIVAEEKNRVFLLVKVRCKSEDAGWINEGHITAQEDILGPR